MRKRTLLRRVLPALMAALVVLVLFAHPYFATTRPSGSKVLVAEGWMHREGLRAAKRSFEEGGYTHLYVTGTVRPFAYYLNAGDTLDVLWHDAQPGPVRIRIAGLPGTAWTLLSGEQVLMQGEAGPGTHTEHLPAREGGYASLRIAATTGGMPPDGPPVLFIGGMHAGGTNVHALGTDVRISRANGTMEHGRPTFAHEGAVLLREEGLPSAQVTPVPAFSSKDRTRSGAAAMAAFARENAIPGYDVATLAVHARRTGRHYRDAAAPLSVGIIALDDPWCRRWTWWTNPYGWFQVLKELAALPGSLWRPSEQAGHGSA